MKSRFLQYGRYPATPTSTGQESAYETLLELIRSGAAQPGQRLTVDMVIYSLSLSRNQAKDILQRLERDGLIVEASGARRGFEIMRPAESKSEAEPVWALVNIRTESSPLVLPDVATPPGPASSLLIQVATFPMVLNKAKKARDGGAGWMKQQGADSYPPPSNVKNL